jgi:hypothetical protein
MVVWGVRAGWVAEAGMKLKINLPIKVGDTLEVFQEEVNRRPIDAKLR